LLLGKVFDDQGNPMTPSYAATVRYRYYVSRALTEGRKNDAGSIARVAADDVERVVCEALQSAHGMGQGTETTSAAISGAVNTGPSNTLSQCQHDDEKFRTQIASQVARVTVCRDAIQIDLAEEGEQSIGRASISVPWRRRPSRPSREIIVPLDLNNDDRRPIRFETRATLLRALANGRAWLDDMVAGRAVDIEQLSARENRSRRSIAMTISLAFLAPDIVEAAVDGRLPRGIGVRRLFDLPSDWIEQRRMLGLPAPR
jgi:site-specific DNA recombinase